MRSVAWLGRVVVSLSLLAWARPATAAPDADEAPSILGGDPTPIGRWPTVVGIVIEVEPGLVYYCTGTLIAPEWVMTAAHCVDPEDFASRDELTRATSVVFDSNDLFEVAGTRMRAAETLEDPRFDHRQLSRDDVGLIRLPVAVTDRTPIPLNRRTVDAPPGTDVTMVGFGQYTDVLDGALHTLTGKPSVSCGALNASDAFLLCFDQRDGTGQCFGDSGGPTLAMIDGVQKQVGIASFGQAASCTTYAGQSRVDFVYNWVADQLGGEWRCADDGECSPRCGAYGNPIDHDCPTCTTDGDCGFQQVCQPNHACGPAPLTVGGLGFACTTDGACGSDACVTRGDESLCSQSCAGDADCPAGFDCTDDGCWPTAPDTGGCSTGRGGGAAHLLLLLAGLALRPRPRRA